MKKILLTFFCFLPAIASLAQSSSTVAIGDTTKYGMLAKKGIITSDGSNVVMGITDSVPAGSTSMCLFVCKTDAHGNVIWNKNFLDSSNSGTTAGLAYMNSAENIGDIIETASGNYLFVYLTRNSSLFFGHPSPNTLGAVGSVFVCELDPAGNVLFSKSYNNQLKKNFSGTRLPQTHKLIQLNDNSIVICGASSDSTNSSGLPNSRLLHPFMLRIDASGNLIWFKNYVFNKDLHEGFQNVIQTSDGNLLAVGYDNINSPNATAMKTDLNGNIIWYNKYTIAGFYGFTHVIELSGSYYAAAWNSTSGILLANIAFNGDLNWSKTINLAGAVVLQPLKDMIASKNNIAFIIGTYNTNLPYDENVIAIKTDLMGNVYKSVFVGALPYGYSMVGSSIAERSCGGYNIYGTRSRAFINFYKQKEQVILIKTDTGMTNSCEVPVNLYTTNTANSFSAITPVAIVDGNFVRTNYPNSYLLTISTTVICTTPLTITATKLQDAACPTSTNGKAVATILTGICPFTYNWSNNTTSDTLKNVSAGVYTVTVTDVGGFTATQTVTINSETSPVFNAPTSTTPSCGSTNGSATITASGGTGSLTYSWNTGATGQTIGPIAAGTYIVTVTDINSCTSSSTVLINSSPSPTITSLLTNGYTCYGLSQGTANAIATGGTAPLTYTWSNGQSGQQDTALAAGTYVLSVKDANGCLAQSTTTINERPEITASSIVVTDATCSSDGSISVTFSGGTSDYTYVWSHIPFMGQTSPSATTSKTNLPVGTYTVYLMDANGCEFTTSQINVGNTSGVTASLAVESAIVCNGGTGSVTATASGGTSQYTYSWSNGTSSTTSSLNNSITSLLASIYTITITDSNGCTSISTANLTEPSAINASASQNTAASCGSSNGSATVFASGGSGTLTYSWSNNATGATASLLIAATYTVTVTDANACTLTTTVTINNSGGPSIISVNPTNPLCSNGTGTAAANASGGTAPLTYNWSNAATGQTVSGLTNGTYTVTVNDANNCPNISTVTIVAPSVINASASQNTAASCGNNNGVAVTVGSGGSGSYTYSWSSGGTGITESNLSANTYSVTITDGNGCTATSTATITNSNGPGITTQSSTGTCIGQSNGQASITVTGGAAPYTYSWSNGTSAITTNLTSQISNLTSQIYTVTITDANNCTATAVAAVALFPSPTAIAGTDQTITSGQSIQLTGSGGISFVWTPSSTLDNANISNPTANPTQTTTYIVTVTDANTCTATDAVTVFVDDSTPCTGNVMFIPTAFSPNEDGQNDVLYLRSAGCVKKLLLQIFDRWGEVVFVTTDVTIGWDGKFNSRNSDTEVFVYTLNAELYSGEVISKNGNFTLIR